MRKFNVLGNLGIIFGSIIGGLFLLLLFTSLSNFKEMQALFITSAIFVAIGITLLVLGILSKKKARAIRDNRVYESNKKIVDQRKKEESKPTPRPTTTTNTSSNNKPQQTWTVTTGDIKRYIGHIYDGYIGFPNKAKYWVSSINVKQSYKVNTFEIEIGLTLMMQVEKLTEEQASKFESDLNAAIDSVGNQVYEKLDPYADSKGFGFEVSVEVEKTC